MVVNRTDEDRARPSWESLLGDPDVYLDGEAEALELIRRWVFGTEAVLPADEFLYLTKPERQT